MNFKQNKDHFQKGVDKMVTRLDKESIRQSKKTLNKKVTQKEFVNLIKDRKMLYVLHNMNKYDKTVDEILATQQMKSFFEKNITKQKSSEKFQTLKKQKDVISEKEIQNLCKIYRDHDKKRDSGILVNDYYHQIYHHTNLSKKRLNLSIDSTKVNKTSIQTTQQLNQSKIDESEKSENSQKPSFKINRHKFLMSEISNNSRQSSQDTIKTPRQNQFSQYSNFSKKQRRIKTCVENDSESEKSCDTLIDRQKATWKKHWNPDYFDNQNKKSQRLNRKSSVDKEISSLYFNKKKSEKTLIKVKKDYSNLNSKSSENSLEKHKMPNFDIDKKLIKNNQNQEIEPKQKIFVKIGKKTLTQPIVLRKIKEYPLIHMR